MASSLTELIRHGGPTVVVLIVLSIASVAVMLDRMAAFRRARRGNEADLERVRGFLREGRIAEARVALAASRHGIVARVVGSGLAELDGASPGRAAWFDRLERARGAMGRAAAEALDGLEARLGFLGTLGSISPFIGLFGTVVGIIREFEAIGRTGTGGLATVSAGIAEALVATAAGLFVAIPAVVAYNYFVGRLRGLALLLENASSEVLDLAARAAGPAPLPEAPLRTGPGATAAGVTGPTGRGAWESPPEPGVAR